MKTTLIALTAIAALTFAPRPAAALGDKEAAIIGGIIGGVIIGAAIDDALDHDHAYTTVSYRHSDGPDYDRNRRDDYNRDRDHHDRYDRDHDYRDNRGGYWTYRTVKVWVPKRTYYTYDRCGNAIRHFESGHWSFEHERVWVSNRGRG